MEHGINLLDNWIVHALGQPPQRGLCVKVALHVAAVVATHKMFPVLIFITNNNINKRTGDIMWAAAVICDTPSNVTQA